MASAEKLEVQTIRDIAIMVRRAGGVLENDIHKKVANQKETDKVVRELAKAHLLTQEFVIICNRTSNQVNRIPSREALSSMTKAGVLCSCGKPISEERIEKLYSPTPILQKMLDKSYWTTARLVDALRQLNITDDHILLNLREGPDEIDALVDMYGALLMFELKDSEFSMGHAYTFSGRIGLYQPDFAIIVSAKGIDTDVKAYFNKVKPQAEIIYVNGFHELNAILKNVVTHVYSNRARKVLSDFSSIEISLSEMFVQKIGLKLNFERRTLPKFYR